MTPKAPSPARRAPSGGEGRPEHEVRERLLGAGRRVFGELGYAGTRVEDVIEAACTSRATFYRYFGSKNDLFVELSRLCFQDMRGVTRAIAAVTPGPDARGQLVVLLEEWQQLLAPTLAAMIERSYLGAPAAAPRRRLRIAGD